MVFSSLLFLFRFLPIMLVVYYCTPRRFRNAVLFGGSLVFYAWGEPVYIILMLFSAAFNYVMGIDIETTGTDPARVYIIDVGFEYMNMISPRPAAAPTGYQYEQSYYETGDAYGQSRLSFGVPAENATLGNPLILDLTGIDVRDRASGFRLFDEWPEAQIGLLQRLEQQPYVAHNARFEHSFFMLNVAGYAESYRAG